jgi:hypothetical protein
MVEPGRPWMTSWIPKARDTHSEYIIFIVYLLQQWLHEYASTLCYTYITRLWILLLFLQHFFQVPYSRHKEQSTAIFLNLLIMDTRMYSLLYFIKYSCRDVFMIVGFRRYVHEICALLSCYAAYSGKSLLTFRVNLSIPSGVKKF